MVEMFFLSRSKFEVCTWFILPVQQLPTFIFSSNGIPWISVKFINNCNVWFAQAVIT